MREVKSASYFAFPILVFLFFLAVTATMCTSKSVQKKPVISDPELIVQRIPLFSEEDNGPSLEVSFNVAVDDKPLELRSVEISLTSDSRTQGLASLAVGFRESGENSTIVSNLGEAVIKGVKGRVRVKKELNQGLHHITFSFKLKEAPDLLTGFRVASVRLTFRNHEDLVLVHDHPFTFRPALCLRAAGQDNCDTYRIPGLVTTREGTLIAVYDNRYNNSKDLQEDIDIGMSRSTDGGQIWEPMRVIMDMGEYGGRSQRHNGIGDPSVLYDHTTHTLWVAAVWMSGSSPDQMLWWASRPGMVPEETGQFMLVKSADDGMTWSEPINITHQIKDPAWQFLLQGPGMGITTRDGTLVFPAQFKADIGEQAIDGGQYTCHSTIIWSKDGGESWSIGTGAKSNTTEAQVVELPDGTLMLNMRDDRNRNDRGETNGRAVAVTSDLGETWSVHPGSTPALPEPNCMASIIAAEVTIDGVKKQVLFFSNPNNKETRTNLTIKASLDGGNSWPAELQQELNATAGFGYSCLTMVDENTIGIVYEGTRDLFFQKILVKDILKNL